jgi:hypothetical protein
MAQYFTFFCVEYPFGPWGVTNQFSLWNLRMYQLSFHSSNISK